MTSATDNRTTELRRLLDERGVEYTANDHMGAYATSWNGFTAMQLTPSAKLMMAFTPEQAIAATLGDDDYECRMDELLCRLTNGKWSKSRSYSVDFMVSCVDEAYEDATLGSEPPYDELLRCLENDWNIRASWDGLRKFWCIELTDEGVRLRDAKVVDNAD